MLAYRVPFFMNKKLKMGSGFDFLLTWCCPLSNKSFLFPGSMFTSSQTITAEKLTSLNRGWRHVDSLKEENGEKAAFIKLRYVFNGPHNGTSFFNQGIFVKENKIKYISTH